MRPLRVRMKFLLLELSSNDDNDNENAPHGSNGTGTVLSSLRALILNAQRFCRCTFLCMASGHDVKVGDINSMDKRDDRHQLVIVSRESESTVCVIEMIIQRSYYGCTLIYHTNWVTIGGASMARTRASTPRNVRNPQAREADMTGGPPERPHLHQQNVTRFYDKDFHNHISRSERPEFE